MMDRLPARTAHPPAPTPPEVLAGRRDVFKSKG